MAAFSRDERPGASAAVRSRFTILEELGKGSCGVVYKARDAKTQELVAVKVLPLTESVRTLAALSAPLPPPSRLVLLANMWVEWGRVRQDEGFDEINKEIEMLQQCAHPNIVRYLGRYRVDTHTWIVMEYCAGGNVSELMHAPGKGLEEAQIAYVCREALKGLLYLHGLFKVHTRVKGSERHRLCRLSQPGH
jgi:serine/threonine protein kinase